jgi:hypothetical protein
MPEKPVESSQKPPVESHSCDICGTFDAQEFGDRWLCLDCYAGCGSCCSGLQTEELC